MHGVLPKTWRLGVMPAWGNAGFGSYASAPGVILINGGAELDRLLDLGLYTL